MRYFREDEVKQLADPDLLIRALNDAFARDFHATVQMPVRTHLDLGGSVLLLMPCYDSALNLAGVKTVTAGAQTGVNAIYTLVDSSTGQILAWMEANWLTDVRTAAISALATDLLARADAKVLGIFGGGRQSFAHLAVLPKVRSFRRFLLCGSGRSDLSAFCHSVRQELGILIETVDAATCARESDVICTCTLSAQPLFEGNWLRAGVHLNVVGAFQPHAREVDSQTVQRARVVVDTYDGCLAEAGDILIPLQEAAITPAQIVADLHEVTSGKKSVRGSANDITLFKSVGCALEDLIAAKLIYERAHE